MDSLRAALTVTLVAVTTCAVELPARADTATAQALFDEGRRLMAAGSYAEACPKLAESQRLDPGAGTLLNLGLCYEKSEHFASAWAAYTEAAAVADRSGRSEWVKRAKDKTAALAPLLSTMTIVVPAERRVDGLAVTRDEHAINPAEWGVKVPVDGGEHVVEAQAPGHEGWSTRVAVPKKHGAITVSVPLLPQTKAVTQVVAAESPRASVAERPLSTGSTQRTVGLVLSVVGLAGLGVGGYFGYRASTKHDDARADCNAAETQCGPRGLSDYRAAEDAATISTIGVIAGGLILVGGVVLYLTAPRSTSAKTAFGSPRFGLAF